jgi:indole-3-glycerol phosphate synthase
MILDQILAETRKRVALLPPGIPANTSPKKTRSLSHAIRSVPFGNAIIGELKFSSPVKGRLRNEEDAEQLARDMVAGGCVALSVITEPSFFGGDSQLLRRVRESLPVPVLRKDFIIDARQVYETQAMGADAILLIARILGHDLPAYISLSRSLGLEPLVEVHSPAEIQGALASGAELLGINNRDLQTMEVDLDTTVRLAPLCGDRIRISMSGILNPAHITRLKPYTDAFLIGSSLMTAPDPRPTLEGFVFA